MNFLGLFTFTAPYLPWVLLAFSFVLGNNGVVDVVGIGVGHLYYFLEDVYPLMLPSRKRVLATPRLIQLLFHNPHDELQLNEQLPHIIHEDQIQQHIPLHDTDRPQQQQQQQVERHEEAPPGVELNAAAVLPVQPSNARLAEAGVEVGHEVQAAAEDIVSSDMTGLHRRRPTAAAPDEPVEAAAPLSLNQA